MVSDWFSIHENPRVPFYIIVDPLNGPGNGSQPNVDYAGCIPKLVAPNTKIVGYVDTDKGTRPPANITRDINTYNGWNSTYRPVGIFFDQVNTVTQLLDFYLAAANTARTLGLNYVRLRPSVCAPVSQSIAPVDCAQPWHPGQRCKVLHVR